MAEPPPDPPMESWRADQVAAMTALRQWATGDAELHHHMARWAELPTTDGLALEQVVWAAHNDEPLSPAQLARRVGLTSGATTFLIDRLERAGLLTRSRDHTDRRRVRLRPTEEGQERVRAFNEFAGVEIAAALRSMDSDDLIGATNFLTKMNLAGEAANQRMRQHKNTASSSDRPQTSS